MTGVVPSCRIVWADATLDLLFFWGGGGGAEPQGKVP
jgi:hypothetical protein